MIRITALILAVLVFLSCHTPNENKLTLFYASNYKNDGWQNQRTGLLWALSYLGAALPKDSLDKAIHWKDSTTFELDFKKLGFTTPALEAIALINDSLKNTAYYKRHQRMDLGYFITATIGSSWHYYKIVGMPARLSEFYTKHPAAGFKTFPLTQSSVASHHRVIRYASATANPCDWVFVAEEGDGSVMDGSFSASVLEVFDIMPNGQLRFGIYDKAGRLIAASPARLGNAGKPAKCLWCHEIVIQPLFRATDSISGRVSPTEFQNDVLENMLMLDKYRRGLKSDIDFENTQDHTQMELLYISYIEPSINRLAVEWNMPEKDAQVIVKSLKKHDHNEFKFLKELLYRHSVPQKDGLPVVEDIREPSANEPDYFKQAGR